MWIWLSVLGLAYTVFQVLQAYLLGEGELSLRHLLYWPAYKPHELAESAKKAWLPALELLAGLFNQAVVSYPASALAALLFLINWRGYQAHFLRAAKRRLGRWWVAVYLCLVLCALAAFCKPLFSLSIYWLNQYLDGIFLLRLGAIIDWLSFQFEYLFGLLIQIFLVLLTFIWIRGLNSEPGRIFEFALKRAVFVAKWAGVFLLMSLFLIHLPLLISYLWITQQTDFTNAVIQYIEQTARPLIAVALILSCSIQVTLTLHNETLREAVQEHAQLVRRHWFRIIWFLVVAGLHFFAISWLNDFIVGAFPRNSVPNLLLSGFITVVRAFLAAWFLASWVCLYRASQPFPREIRF
ncbi:MAG: hypothetical protein JO298_03135 [Verrucomicrobia bacterium]|nr:hypothetical protein [Verrucomicrobiota bacterium]